MDFLRLILPQIISLISFLILFWFFSFCAKSTLEKETWQKVSIWVNRFALLVVILFIIWMIRIVSVNEIPRAEGDHSIKDKMHNNFEERMKNDTLK